MERSQAKNVLGFDYWLQWQVLVCALIFLLPAAVAVFLLKKRTSAGSNPLNSTDLWVPCWRNLSPKWLLFYRAIAFVSMSFLLYEIAAAFGFFVFFFYTQWTFALVMVYFAIGTAVSAHGCWIYSRRPLSESGERDKFLKKESEDRKHAMTSISKEKQAKHEQRAGFWEHLMHMIYQTCGGAVMLTDIVFWGLLLPFMTGENFQLTLLIGCMHSVNALLLILDSAVNNMPFPWFGLVYFVLWSVAYVVFQWVLHACCFTWWPYPFLELSTPWAPLWYLALALVHIPCYGLYVLLVKGKQALFSRMFPHSFVRAPMEKKHA
ncbi:unnamed protein product [Fraxinus pennsylvanica]|uniref:Uncharacterized protein n=1 Tax=Fraxinus pennsylvanica TaxID=56036 RepID=A0AAD2AHN2_9LAMI|nr:unnamed protein product [Fraxinus pennsylvanica]